MQKAGVNLLPFPDAKAVLKQRRLWRSIAAQVETGDMPPDGEKQPAKEQRERLVRRVGQPANPSAVAIA